MPADWFVNQRSWAKACNFLPGKPRAPTRDLDGQPEVGIGSFNKNFSGTGIHGYWTLGQ